MATLVLAAVGNAVLPGLGQVLGALAGAYIDNVLLFPPKPVKGQRLDGLDLQSGTEGSPLSYCLGNECRVAGTVIWVSPLLEQRNTEGGKGGGPEVENYTYSVDVAIAICEGPIFRVSKIFANGNVLYDDEPDVIIVSNQIAAVNGTFLIYYGNYGVGTNEYYLDLNSPAGGPDLSQLRSGIDVTMSGWSTGALNITARCIGSSKDTVTGTSTARLHRTSSAFSSDAGGETVTLVQDLPKFSPEKATAFVFYTGTDSQLPDSIMQGYEGIANVPAYRSIAYVLIQGLQLKDYGNTLPQLSFQVEESAAPRTLQSAAEALWARTKRPPEEFDASALTGNMRGLVVRGPAPVGESLERLFRAYDVLTQEDNSVIRCFMRADAEEVTIKEEDLACDEPESNPPRPIKVTDAPAKSLPRRVEVSYIDPALDYQEGSQMERRIRGVENLATVDFDGITLSATEAKNAARRILFQAWVNGRRFMFQLPPEYMRLAEGDIAHIPARGQTYRVLVMKAEQGANGQLLYEGVREETTITSVTNAVADTPNIDRNDPYIPPQMIGIFMEVAPLTDAEVLVPTFKHAACAAGIADDFRGATLFRSTDAGNSFISVSTILQESIIGRCSTTLGTVVMEGAYWDNKNTLTVTVFEGALESRSELAVLGGANHALVGREVIAYKTATLTAPNTYQLSGLMRGRRNTTQHITTHVANEMFVLLSDGRFSTLQISTSYLNASHLFRCVPFAGIIGDYPSNAVTMLGENLRPFPPCALRAQRDSSGNITIAWNRRTRALARLLGGTYMPLAEENERYEVEILNVAETLVLRTLSLTTSTTIYLAADQTTDGLVVGAALHIRVYQLSTTVGRSRAASATV